jgi:hypothetical protein
MTTNADQDVGFMTKASEKRRKIIVPGLLESGGVTNDSP